MPRVTIDNREVEVTPGSTLLDAARQLGLDVPALCCHPGCTPNTSCMTCVMKVKDPDRIVPSCATLAEDGLRAESETDEVRQLRRTALELLLSDHVGECRAPCQNACPAGLNIPRMIRAVADGRLDHAIATVRDELPLAGVLARVCPGLCERACRRSALDEAVATNLLTRYVADRDREAPSPHRPPCRAPSGKKVAIIGAGPAGLSAAYFLLQQGHACTLFERQAAPGGSLRGFSEQQLPPAVLAVEIRLIESLGAGFELGTIIGRDRTLAELRQAFDAVLIAAGTLDSQAAKRLGLKPVDGHFPVDPKTHVTEISGVFATGNALRPQAQPVRAAADGKAAATCIDQYVRGVPVAGPAREFTMKAARPASDDLAQMARGTNPAARVTLSADSADGLSDEEAVAEAQRCLHCDCGKLETCRLRKYARMYRADASRYRGARRQLERRRLYPDLLFEPGKCIVCGLCVQIAEQLREPLGLTLVGRGFDVRVDVPLDEPVSKALTVAAQRCVAACPTGALAWRSP